LRAIKTPEYSSKSILILTHYILSLIRAINKTDELKAKNRLLLLLAETFFTNARLFQESYENLVKFKIIDPFPSEWLIVGQEYIPHTNWNRIGIIIINCYVIKN